MAENRAAELNGGVNEDEALRIAIAMSLGQDPAADRNARDDAVVDLTSDQDDDETESGSDGDGDGNEPIVTKPLHVPSSPRKPQDQGQQQQQRHVVPSSLSGLAAPGIDRKAMEQERLARLNKRKASSPPSEPVELRPQQRQKTLANEGLGRVLQPSKSDRELPSRDVKIGGDGRVRPNQPYKNDGDGSGTTVPFVTRGEQRSRLPYPRGVVKKTWAYGHARQGDDIRIEEVLQKGKLKLAVLSSYQWDDEWLLSKVDLARTKVILVAFAATETKKEEMRSNVPRERIRFCFPPMLGVGSMHSKLQLLKYDDYLRIVVPTGNLVSYDWGETGVIENMVFLIDLPKLETAEQRDTQQFTAFGDDLSYFLLAQGLSEKLVDSLRNYDFSETSRYAFVHTIAGSHSLEERWSRTGYCGLGRAAKALGLGLEEPVEVDFVCASIGAVNDSLLSALYYACQGDSGVKEYESRTAGGRKVKDAKSGQDDDVAAIKRHFRVYFPSEETVLESKGGKDVGTTTICDLTNLLNPPRLL
ncbi:tyrosyl-DNA phosphodiesterase-domain-containing protein [Lasiosphaeria miniovina]|uniref:Tyrosyl-DNA phosphodiesterase-domain-containing protein n=1 Tax=Lasiosphaeria miniovina TaxID=1954250 RepID=A0AA40AVD1_9PEZI|nr:tyrosyl-DNA phosphodiesterase-domain-containing protein [Lasiosphaeria miniovina]KAK0722710.1 tyrosyl-DNA phosphodiesterase-domain-containing protein [Lasiosphaeria miniovina]